MIDDSIATQKKIDDIESEIRLPRQCRLGFTEFEFKKTGTVCGRRRHYLVQLAHSSMSDVHAGTQLQMNPTGQSGLDFFSEAIVIDGVAPLAPVAVSPDTTERVERFAGSRAFGFGAFLFPLLGRREAQVVRLVSKLLHVAVDRRPWLVRLSV